MKIYYDSDDGRVVIEREDEQHFLSTDETLRLSVEMSRAVFEWQSAESTQNEQKKELISRLLKIKALVLDGGTTDGAHHKQWYLDQILRVLQGADSNYQEFIQKEFCGNWDEGIAP